MAVEPPKIDLHLHSESAARIDRLYAAREGRPPYDWGGWTDSLAGYPSGDARLARMNGHLDTGRFDSFDRSDDVFLARTTDVLEEAARDGAVLVEVRFGSATVLRPNFMDLFREAERRVRARGARIYAEALVSLWPSLAHDERLLAGCLDARRSSLAGVDFLPNPYSEQADWTQAHRWSEAFASAGLGITAHAGEFATVNVQPALNLKGLARLGHGIRIADDDRLLGQVVERRLTLEVCLTSNLVYGNVRLADHPIRDLVDSGVKVTLNSDCPVRLRTSIAREYRLAAQFGFGERDLLAFTLNALEASFTSPERKAEIRSWLAGP